jgi:hypothetical protein
VNFGVTRVEYMLRSIMLVGYIKSWKLQHRVQQRRAERFSTTRINYRTPAPGCWRYRQLPAKTMLIRVRAMFVESLITVSMTAKWSSPGRVRGWPARFPIYYSESPNVWQDGTWRKKRPPIFKWLRIYDHLSSPFDIMLHGPVQFKELS